MNHPITFCRVLTLLLFSLTATAQYQPFVVENANWIGFYGDPGSKAFTISGDTIIKDTVYKKLYERVYYSNAAAPWNASPPYAVGAPTFIGVLREDTLTKKVFGRVYLYDRPNELSRDTLVHDFAPVVGDTLRALYYGYDIWNVETVERDTQLLYGKLRPVVLINGLQPLIEGIGDYHSGPLGFKTLFTATGHCYLIDHCVGTFSECNIDQLTSLTANISPDPLAIYPVPANDKIFISGVFLEASRPAEVSVFTAAGKLVFSRRYPTQLTSLDVGDLPSGAYIVQIVQGKLTSVGRFIKQ